VERLEDRFEDARSSLNAALALVTSVDEVSVAVHIRNALAEIEFELGNARGALAIAEGLAAAMESHGTQFPYLCNTCAYHIVLGESAEAKRVARQLLDRVHGSHPMYVIVILEHVSTIAALEGRSHTAARLRGYTEESGRRIGYVREQTEEHCYAIGTRALRERCSDEELNVWTAQGAQLSEERAIALALTEGL
jgi:ATP/maltotriose-dependent transcriptional regulator MalT